MEKQLVVFELAGESYGVEIASVESIIKMQSITAIPQAPEFIKGITNLRGIVLPVMDLRQRLALPAAESTQESRIVVVVLDSVKVGMVVDAVSEVLRISEDVIEPAPAIVTTVNSAFITGIAKLDQRLVILLDLARVLNENEITALQAV